ncbi:MAG: YggS family pyridoxal phosphate-dependent enzyme [Lautropia sp.]|nr:YggS family pyridoxal phosphate-dependent enzyme [Lautropia sp.]
MKPHLQAMNGNSALEQRYLQVKTRIRRAAQAAGRNPDGIHLLAVSKTFPAGSIAALAAIGQLDFGENYLQEALGKMAALAHLRPHWPLGGAPVDGRQQMPVLRPDGLRDVSLDGLLETLPNELEPGLQWHFIGPIQSNKTRKIAEAFDWVQSVGEERIARRLSEQRPAHLPPLNVCIQVNASGEPTKSGCSPDQADALAPAVAELPNLRLRGLMAIPEPTEDEAVQLRRAGEMRGLFERVRESLGAGAVAGHFDTLSMGMSADLESAIAQGSSLVRVGSALFGERKI